MGQRASGGVKVGDNPQGLTPAQGYFHQVAGLNMEGSWDGVSKKLIALTGDFGDGDDVGRSSRYIFLR